MRANEIHESAVEELKNRLPKLKRHTYNTIDSLMQDISFRHKITGKKLHDLFVHKYGHTPDRWIKKLKDRLEEQGSESDAYGNTGEKHECGSCDGTGIVTHDELMKAVEYDDECPECGGKGWVRDKESLKKKGVAEGLDEAVGGNYLYHATSAAGLKGMLSSGSISQAKGPQKATQAQTAAPTVSVTRDWGYASGSTATQQSFGGIGRDAVIVLDRNTIESNFKTLGTSQSHDIRGLPRVNEPELAGRLKMRAIAMKQPELKGQNKMNFGTAKAGGEFEEAVVVPKGALPLKGTMVGFWVNPKSELMKDPAIMNDPRRLDMVRPNQFVKAKQEQGVAEEYELAGVGVAYELGRRAYKQGMTIRDNPYSATREARKNDEWAKGLERGKHDANDARHFRSSVREQAVAEGYQLDEGAIETITALAKKIPGIGKYYQMAQQYKPQLIEILKTSKSGKEVKQKMEQLAAGQSATVTESGMMKQLGGLAVGGGSILSTMWMNAMGLIDGVLAHAAAGEVGGAVASGSILGLIPVTLMLFAAMLLFKGSNQSSDEKAQAFQAQRRQQGVAEDWNKVNKKDKTSGMSQKAVNAYRRENPGSKLKTAVTTKPSKLKPGSKAAKRRKSFCARMGGNKGPMKKPNGKPTPKALALRRWNCESVEELEKLVMIAEQKINEAKNLKQRAAIAIAKKQSVTEMDKSQTPPGRDGSNDSDAGKKEYTAKTTTAKTVAKDGEKTLNKIFKDTPKKKVSESVDNADQLQQIKDFINWSMKTLNMQKPYPKFTLSRNTQQAQKGHHTGLHHGDTIWVYIENRNLVDIFRTIFHELVHHRQDQLDMIKDGDSYPGSPIEALADMMAGKYIKIYGKEHPEIFQ